MSKLIIKLVRAFRKSLTYPAALGKSTDTSESVFISAEEKQVLPYKIAVSSYAFMGRNLTV